MRQLKIQKKITSREEESLQKYLTEISHYPQIDQKMEATLAQKIKAGDENAHTQLVHANLRFVVSVAKQYQNNGLALSDLINEGNVGLMKAAWRFDETRGFKFISFAVWWIRQAVQQAITEQGRMVRLPHNKVSLKYQTEKAISRLTHDLEREPNTEEIAAYLDVSLDEVEKALTLKNWNCTSLDARIHDDSDFTLMDSLVNDSIDSPDKSLTMVDLSTDIGRVLNVLPVRFQEFIIHRFGLFGKTKKSYEEIAKLYHMKESRVKSFTERALRKIKFHKATKNLKVYL